MLLKVLAVPRPLLEEQENMVDVLVAVPELKIHHFRLHSVYSIKDHPVDEA